MKVAQQANKQKTKEMSNYWLKTNIYFFSVSNFKELLSFVKS